MIEIEDDIILSKIIGCKGYYKRAPEFGERAWLAEGKEVDVVLWDTGNGCYVIMQVIPKGCKECKQTSVEFYKKLAKYCDDP